MFTKQLRFFVDYAKMGNGENKFLAPTIYFQKGVLTMANLFNAKDLLNKVDLADAKNMLEKVDKKDILGRVDEIVDTIKANKDLIEKFDKEPVAVLESIIGIDLPNDQVEKVIDAVKAKLTIDDIQDVIGGLGKLFNRK